MKDPQKKALGPPRPLRSMNDPIMLGVKLELFVGFMRNKGKK